MLKRSTRINERNEEHFLGCEGGEAKMLRQPSTWTLIQLLDGWVRLYNPQDGRYLSLDDQRDGGYLYCLEAFPDPDVSEQAAFFVLRSGFFIQAMKKRTLPL